MFGTHTQTDRQEDMNVSFYYFLFPSNPLVCFILFTHKLQSLGQGRRKKNRKAPKRLESFIIRSLGTEPVLGANGSASMFSLLATFGLSRLELHPAAIPSNDLIVVAIAKTFANATTIDEEDDHNQSEQTEERAEDNHQHLGVHLAGAPGEIIETVTALLGHRMQYGVRVVGTLLRLDAIVTLDVRHTFVTVRVMARALVLGCRCHRCRRGFRSRCRCFGTLDRGAKEEDQDEPSNKGENSRRGHCAWLRTHDMTTRCILSTTILWRFTQTHTHRTDLVGVFVEKETDRLAAPHTQHNNTTTQSRGKNINE